MRGVSRFGYGWERPRVDCLRACSFARWVVAICLFGLTSCDQGGQTERDDGLSLDGGTEQDLSRSVSVQRNEDGDSHHEEDGGFGDEIDGAASGGPSETDATDDARCEQASTAYEPSGGICLHEGKPCDAPLAAWVVYRGPSACRHIRSDVYTSHAGHGSQAGLLDGGARCAPAS